MLGNEIEDLKQLQAIRRKIRNEAGRRYFFRSLYHCGSKVVVDENKRAAVAVLANNKTARFYGVTHCKSPWCCPVCTSRQMAKYAADIAVAIDALKEQDQQAAMITFTVPHTSGFTCEQTTEILYNVWKAFTVHGNKILAASKNDIFSNFMAATEAKHRVRVCEYTWGNAGWHPHFHTLFWFPKKHFNEIVQWEEQLENRWLELCKRYTIRQLLIGYPETQRKTVKAKVTKRVEIMYKNLDDGCHGLYISKKNNLPIVQESSNYICGWGANRELTGNVSYKASHDGHFTWQQILQNAIDEDKLAEDSRKNEVSVDAVQVQAEAENKWWTLFFEYAEATKKYRHARINFSVHSGLKKIIADYKKSNAYKTFSKKNNEKLQKEFGKWRVVCWFTKSQWLSICEKELQVDILKFAVNGGLTEINRLLEAYDIPPAVQNIEAAAVLENIYNCAA